MEWLKAILNDDELVSKVTSELGKHFIPKDQYNKKVEEVTSVRTELDAIKGDVTSLTTSAESLKAKAEEADRLKTELDNLKTSSETLKTESEKQLTRVKKEYILERKLLEKGAVKEGIDLLKRDFDLDTMELDGEDIKDFDTLSEPIMTKRKPFFYSESHQGTDFKQSDPPPKDTKTMSVEEFAKHANLRGLK